MSEPPSEVEHLERSGPAELGARHIDRGLHDIEVLHDVVTGEEVVGKLSPVTEQLRWKLAAQHLPVGDALARVGLGDSVETLNSDG